jgi:hypothetical protein
MEIEREARESRTEILIILICNTTSVSIGVTKEKG